MVFTANRLPHQIPELIEGLRSRLSWGLIVRIREPDPDSYRQLIEAFLDASETEISEEISAYLAEQGSISFHDLKDFVEKLQEVVEKQQGYYWLDAPPRTLAAQPHRPAYGSDGDYWSKPNIETIFDAAYEIMSEANPTSYPSFYN